MNQSIQQLISLANERKEGRPFLIAIDGHSAAGKSTLANYVAKLLATTAIVHTDDFYRPMNEEKRFELNPQEGYEYYYDWQRLKQDVLQPLSTMQAAEFRTYDWQNNRLNGWKRMEPTNFIIVEGCYSARLEFGPFFNVIVFVETPLRERQRRQTERNDAMQAWLDRWEASERFYIEMTNLQERADIVVSGLQVPYGQ
jgi:uridine kinase